MIVEDELLTRLRAADPVHHKQLRDLELDAVLATAARADLDDRRQAKRRRTLRLGLVAGVAAVAVLAVPVVAPRAPVPGGPASTPGQWLPNAAAAELDNLAAAVTTTPLGDRYAYWSEQQINLSSMYPVADATPARFWDTRTIQYWKGTSCDDRQVESWRAYKFLSARDENIWTAWANSDGVAAEDRAAARGGTHEWTGSQLWDSPADGDAVNPCERGGSIANPTPGYTSSLPTDPRQLLDRLVQDAGPLAEDDRDAPAGLVLSLMSVPWLTQAQRASLIEAVGLLPQSWSVTRKTTVDGHAALWISRETKGVREDVLIAAAAPGIWEHTMTIADPEQAAPWSGGAWVGLPAGTVVSSMKVVQSGIVSDVSSAP